MSLRALLSLMLWIGVMAPAVAGDTLDNLADRAAIAAASQAFSSAFVANDTAAIARLYTEDAVLLAPGKRVARGRAAAAKHFAWAPDYRQLAHAMTSESLDLRGDTAVDVGSWHSTSQRGDAAPSQECGAYVVVWVREADGAWRMAYDAWHRPLPPAPR